MQADIHADVEVVHESRSDVSGDNWKGRLQQMGSIVKS